MPDRRRRTAFRLPRPERPTPLTRERSSSSPDSSSAAGSSGSPSAGGPRDPREDNPFAPPPADRPDQPWRPRRPYAASGSGGTGGNEGSEGSGSGAEGSGGNGSGSSADRPAWGSQWSDRQPGREGGGFGGRPGGNGSGGPGGKGGNDRGGPGGLRWDPKDPVQRRARYAVLGGMWAFFFALFDFPEIALLLGALATYWAISALRAPLGKASGADGAGTAGSAAGDGTGAADGAGAAPAGQPAVPRSIAGRQQTTAAVSGLVTALLALLIVATTFTVQLVYRDYYTCVNDALTKSGAVACNDRLPKPLEPFFGVKE
ncbi:hypothetical protein ACFV2V_21765 [Streptomyces sp. NPDC059698]|uniref:hypothetical protein n=1 Tax=unclassified Streptomyces TaxID=2593676 RepID=UPI000A42D6B2|nr:hypothetical protein [Streptomyces sp. CB02366]